MDVTLISEYAARFANIFNGSSSTWGGIIAQEGRDSRGKRNREIRHYTSRPIHTTDFVGHLNPEEPGYSIGRAPITDPSDGEVGETVYFGAIDVDEYKAEANTAEALARAASEHGFPLFVADSYSGGAHAFLFASDGVPAETMRAALRRMATFMGLPEDVEIFPKQERVAPGEQQNWIALPYANGTERRMLSFDRERERLDLLEFFAVFERLSKVGLLSGSAVASWAKGDHERSAEDASLDVRNETSKTADPLPDGYERFSFPETVPEGQRHRVMLSYAGQLQSRGLPDAEIERLLRLAAVERLDPPWELGVGAKDEGELRDILARALRYAKGDPPPEWAMKMNERYVVIRGMGIYDHASRFWPADSAFAMDYPFPVQVGTLKGTGAPKYAKQATAWLNSRHRASADALVFDPGLSHDAARAKGVFNLFKGWGVAPSEEGSCELFKRHLHDIMANGDVATSTYLWNWLAWMVQRPTKKLGTCPSFRGVQGSGKGALVRYLQPIFEPHFIHITDSDRLFSRFNDSLESTMFVFLDEAVWARTQKHLGLLKALITEPTMVIEPKGKPIRTVDNHMWFMIASNDEQFVPVQSGNRRFLAVEVSDSVAQSQDYFERLNYEAREGGRARLLWELQNVELPKYGLEMPMTGTTAEQILGGLDPVGDWLYECLRRGEFSSFVHNEFRSEEDVAIPWTENRPVKITKDEFFSMMGDWLFKKGARNREDFLHRASTSRRFRAYLGADNFVNRYGYYRVGPLARARRDFAETLGIELGILFESEEEESDEPEASAF